MFNDSFQEKKVQEWMFMDYTNLVIILMPFKGKIEQFKKFKTYLKKFTTLNA